MGNRGETSGKSRTVFRSRVQRFLLAGIASQNWGMTVVQSSVVVFQIPYGSPDRVQAQTVKLSNSKTCPVPRE